MAEKKRILTTYESADHLNLEAVTVSQLDAHMRTHAAIFRPMMILSHPGVGKTTKAYEIAGNLHMKPIYCSLIGKDQTDFGLPFVYNDCSNQRRHGFTLPEWAPTFKDELDPNYPGGWMFIIDEVDKAVPAVQSRIAEVLHEHTLDGVRLHPKFWTVMLGNLPSSRVGGFPIPKHIPNRAGVYVLAPSGNDFRAWCGANGKRTEIVAFSKLHEADNVLDSFDPEQITNCTCRSLAALSDLMDQGVPDDQLPAMARATIGRGRGTEFAGFVKVWEELPRLEDIESKPKKMPLFSKDRPDIQCALAAMLGRAMNEKNIDALITYLMRMPTEYCVMALNDAVCRNQALRSTSAFWEWCQKHGDCIL